MIAPARRRSGSARRGCDVGRASSGGVPSCRAMCTVRATSSHITAALTAARASRPMVNGPWLAISTARRAAAAQGLDDAAADGVVADQRERADRDLAAELVGDHREHARDRLAARGPGGGVGGVGVHHPADVGQVPVDVGVRGGVRRRRVVALDQHPVEVGDDHGVRGELVVGHAGRLDHHQVVAGHPGRDVARRSRRPGRCGSARRAASATSRRSRATVAVEIGRARSRADPPPVPGCPAAARRRALSRCMTSLAPRPK